MNGIDTSAASLLASRIGALGPSASQGSAGAAQTGVSALAGGVAALADPQSPGSPQASAQAVLSAVALALDAIIRSGGEATPAVVGRAPLWADPGASGDTPAGDAGSLPLPGVPNSAAQAGGVTQAQAQIQALEAALLADLAAADGGAGLPGGAQDADGAAAADDASASTPQGAQAAQGTALAAQSGPVAALAATLAQTVASSGLFYESHLAQWLRGQRTPAELADEPQNRLTSGGAQLPLDWGQDDIDDVLWTDLSGAAQQGARAANAANAANMANAAAPGARGDAAALAQDAARAGAGAAALAETLLPAARTPAGTGAGVGVHEALLPLVRQQLDLLATGEFRWTGEAWPGVRLDWSIEQDDDGRRDPRAGRSAADDSDEMSWRTRLTLALPALGTVDAELTLAGSTLAVRVQASPGGARRLTAHGEALRGRLEALGLALAGLSIREIGGSDGASVGGAMGMDGARAAGAYARAAAAQANDAHAASPGEMHGAAPTSQAAYAADAPPATDSTDWELG